MRMKADMDSQEKKDENMSGNKEQFSFDEQWCRIVEVTAAKTFADVATALDVRQSAVSDAKRRGRIPSHWLETILRKYGVSRQWILTGRGPEPSGKAKNQDSAGEALSEEEGMIAFLRTVPDALLTDELQRRLDAAEMTEDMK